VAGKSRCDCVKDFEALLVPRRAACGRDYEIELTLTGVIKDSACSAAGLAQCTPFQFATLNQLNEDVGTCSTANTKDDIVQVGKLCDCLVPLQAKLDAGNFTTCPFFEVAADVLSLKFQTNRCSTNKGTNAVCDNKAIEACSKGLSMCQADILGGLSLWCPCWASYGKCIEQNKNCQSAVIFQNGFYELCRTSCPATTDCGQPGVTLSFRPITSAPEYVTDTNGAFVTGPGGVRLTVAPTVEPVPTVPSDVESDDQFGGCNVAQALKAAFCASSCANELTTQAAGCTCRHKVHDCVKDAGCSVRPSTPAEKEQCLKDCPGLQACSSVASMIANIAVVVIAATFSML